MTGRLSSPQKRATYLKDSVLKQVEEESWG